MNHAFKHMENIENFCKAMTALGVPDADNFNTIDLYESRNLYQVMISIESLGRIVQKLGLNHIPKLGAKIADKGTVKSFEVGTAGTAGLSFAEAAALDLSKNNKEITIGRNVDVMSVVKFNDDKVKASGSASLSKFEQAQVDIAKDPNMKTIEYSHTNIDKMQNVKFSNSAKK